MTNIKDKNAQEEYNVMSKIESYFDEIQKSNILNKTYYLLHMSV